MFRPVILRVPAFAVMSLCCTVIRADTAYGVLQVSVTVVDTCSVAVVELPKEPAQASVKCAGATGYRISQAPVPVARSQTGTTSVSMVADTTAASSRQITLVTISY